MNNRRKHGSNLGLRVAAASIGMCTLSSVLSQTNQGASGVAPPPAVAPAVRQFDTGIADYRFRNGSALHALNLHYATLGSPTRDAAGQVNNAILVLHWTGSSSANMLTPEYIHALFDPGRPLDASRYYLIFPDSIGHGRSSKPSDGMRSSFPAYGYGDEVDLQHHLVSKVLGIRHLKAILGVSMGGMNAWQWAEAYPDEMDAVMAVVSLPVPVSGRNLLWRRMVIDEIRSDPQFDGGNYIKQPPAYFRAYTILRMMIDGVPHLQDTIPDVQASESFMASARAQAATGDANDLLFSLQASRDYNPLPGIGRIATRLYALNFDDDEFNPDSLHLLEDIVRRIPTASFEVQAGNSRSYGHLTMAHPMLWADKVDKFMRSLETSSASRPSAKIN